MNEKTINEQYAYIYSLLEDRRLKEALIQLESLLWQCSDWDLRTRLEQLQTSYKYMRDYMRQGANDPERWNLYQKMLTDSCRFRTSSIFVSESNPLTAKSSLKDSNICSIVLMP